MTALKSSDVPQGKQEARGGEWTQVVQGLVAKHEVTQSGLDFQPNLVWVLLLQVSLVIRNDNELESSRKYFPAFLPPPLLFSFLLSFPPSFLSFLPPSLPPQQQGWALLEHLSPLDFTRECQGPESGCGMASVSAKLLSSNRTLGSKFQEEKTTQRGHYRGNYY